MRAVIAMLFGVLLTIAGIMTGSVLATRAWQAEPEPEPARTVSIEEYHRGRTTTASKAGRPAPGCSECSKYVLTDYRRSPTVFGPNGLYKGRFKGDEFIFDTPPAR